MRRKLTQAFCDHAQPSAKARPSVPDVYYHTKTPGLHLDVHCGAHKSFLFRGRINGREINPRIGAVWQVSLAEAEETARDWARLMAQGIHPLDARRAQRASQAREQGNTFEAVAKDFAAHHLAAQRSGVKRNSMLQTTMVDRWGKRPIGSIETVDAIELIEEKTRAGQAATARKIKSLGQKLFGWAAARQLVDRNPFADIRVSDFAGQAITRDRILTDSELAGLWNAAGGMGDPLIKLLILTGARESEIAAGRWAEIDFAAKVWTVPASRMKGKLDHLIPLSPQALAVLNSLPRDGDFVLGKRAFTSFSDLKKRIDEAMPDVPHFVFHDVRRTVRSGLARLRVQTEVCEAILAHRLRGVVGTYNRHDYADEKASALEAWGNFVDGLLSPRPEKIIKIGRRG